MASSLSVAHGVATQLMYRLSESMLDTYVYGYGALLKEPTLPVSGLSDETKTCDMNDYVSMRF